MEKYRRSVIKPNQGPTIEWFGGECPVAPGTPVSIMYRELAESPYCKYWTNAGSKPEALDWNHTGGPRDILAYYVRDVLKSVSDLETQAEQAMSRYLAFTGAGFSEQQAFELVKASIGGGWNNPG